MVKMRQGYKISHKFCATESYRDFKAGVKKEQYIYEMQNFQCLRIKA